MFHRWLSRASIDSIFEMSAPFASRSSFALPWSQFSNDLHGSQKQLENYIWYILYLVASTVSTHWKNMRKSNWIIFSGRGCLEQCHIPTVPWSYGRILHVQVSKVHIRPFQSQNENFSESFTEKLTKTRFISRKQLWHKSHFYIFFPILNYPPPPDSRDSVGWLPCVPCGAVEGVSKLAWLKDPVQAYSRKEMEKEIFPQVMCYIWGIMRLILFILDSQSEKLKQNVL